MDRNHLVAGLLLFLAPMRVTAEPCIVTAKPETRALAYLARESASWRRENGCFSCHNNGDAVRALLDGQRRGYPLPSNDALGQTLNWLDRPERWDHNGGEGPFSDKRLARIQFAFALQASNAGRRVPQDSPLARAADMLATDQAPDGSWALDGADALGSPATYGRPLATAVAREILRAADPRAHHLAITRAEAWLAGINFASTLDASAVLWTFDLQTRAGARARDWLASRQAPDGGWGPYAGSAAEPFDTAVALLSLVRAGVDPSSSLIQRGRAALVVAQQGDGSWLETTRPAGAESYAQRVSTTAWATLALLATGKAPERPTPSR